MSDQAGGPAETAEEVTFSWSPGRFLVVILVWGMAGTAGGLAAFFALHLPADLADGRPLRGADVEFLVTFFSIYVTGFVGFSLLFTRSRPPWLRITASGMELAAAGRDSAFIPWSAVSSAKLRWTGPFTALQITVSDPREVARGYRGGRRPPRRRRAGRVRFIANVGVLRVDPATIRAELGRRGCTVR